MSVLGDLVDIKQDDPTVHADGESTFVDIHYKVSNTSSGNLDDVICVVDVRIFLKEEPGETIDALRQRALLSGRAIIEEMADRFRS